MPTMCQLALKNYRQFNAIIFKNFNIQKTEEKQKKNERTKRDGARIPIKNPYYNNNR